MNRKARQSTAQPLLYAVRHDPDALERARHKLKIWHERGIQSVGLELPENYERTWSRMTHDPFFHPLARSLLEIGMKLIPLDTKEMYGRRIEV